VRRRWVGRLGRRVERLGRRVERLGGRVERLGGLWWVLPNWPCAAGESDAGGLWQAPALTPDKKTLNIDEGVRAATIPGGGGIFVVASGNDNDGKGAFVAMLWSLEAKNVWATSTREQEGATGPVSASTELLLLGGRQLWRFDALTGSMLPGPANGTGSPGGRRIVALAERAGQFMAVLATAASSGNEHGGVTAFVNPTSLQLEQEQAYSLPGLEWDYKGVPRNTQGAAPRAAIPLAEGWGLQGGTRGHNYVAFLGADRKLAGFAQSYEQDSFYVEPSGLGRKGSELVYVANVEGSAQVNRVRASSPENRSGAAPCPRSKMAARHALSWRPPQVTWSFSSAKESRCSTARTAAAPRK
jgi:hypothetical protein